MAMFTVRVELHRAIEQSYKLLHEAMARLGFSRTIRADSGVDYILPTAEYDYRGTVTSADVLVLARQAVDATGHNGWILVTEAVNRTWVLAAA